MAPYRLTRMVLALTGVASLAGCYERQPVEMKIRPISSPSSSIGAPASAQPIKQPAEEHEQEEKPEDPPVNSEKPRAADKDK